MEKMLEIDYDAFNENLLS